MIRRVKKVLMDLIIAKDHCSEEGQKYINRAIESILETEVGSEDELELVDIFNNGKSIKHTPPRNPPKRPKPQGEIRLNINKITVLSLWEGVKRCF